MSKPSSAAISGLRALAPCFDGERHLDDGMRAINATDASE